MLYAVIALYRFVTRVPLGGMFVINGRFRMGTPKASYFHSPVKAVLCTGLQTDSAKKVLNGLVMDITA